MKLLRILVKVSKASIRKPTYYLHLLHLLTTLGDSYYDSHADILSNKVFMLVLEKTKFEANLLQVPVILAPIFFVVCKIIKKISLVR